MAVMTARSMAVLVVTAAILVQPGRAQTQASPRADFLQLIARTHADLAPQVTTLPPSGRLSREHFTFAADAHERVPGIALKTTAARGRVPAVIVLHGTGDSKEGMVPLLEALAARGFLAVGFDARYHGERAAGPNDYLQAILRAYRTGDGHPFLYDTVGDAMRLVDYLETRPDVDRARIGMLGISMGGMETYLAAAVDPRIAVAVPVIGVQGFGWALKNNAWQARVETILPAVAGAARDALRPVDTAFVRDFYDRVVPGIYSEFDAPAMLPLIAPRPLLVINGDSDALTPLAGVEASASAAEDAYRRAGAAGSFRLLVQPDAGHEFTLQGQRAALDWLVRWLKP
jgi:dienelactone hydrolase